MVRTVKLETAELLRDAGFKKDTLHTWCQRKKVIGEGFYRPDLFMDLSEHGLRVLAPAPVAEELLDDLPKHIKLDDWSCILEIRYWNSDKLAVCYYHPHSFKEFEDEILVEAVAKAWLWVKAYEKRLVSKE